ncbi:Bardet-Biedl syndrome 2 protein-like protein [Aphelenchoides fujianensis]|nr:Bardet-Biedl syndrome 2 protein-like protein [Aphelenchoides fujianensis]
MRGSLKEVLNYSFNHRIARNSCTVGRFDQSEREKMVAGTSSSKIVIQNSESIFHVNEPITALNVFRPKDGDYDHVVVGTEKSLLMFDVYNNKTIFHKDMPEGINVILIGMIDEFNEQLVVCGCGTTIWGINAKGEDVYWTTLGDDVNAMTICDIDSDGHNELIVGTSGSEMKVLKNASLQREIVEGDPTVVLCTIQTGIFAFGLSNGVIGIYRKWERLVASEDEASDLRPGSLPRTTQRFARSHIDVRNVENGENYRKTQLDGEVAAVFAADVQQTGAKQLMLAYYNGKIRGVALNPDEDEQDQTTAILHEYGQRKHNLMEELKNYEAADRSDSNQPGIPADTQMECTLELTMDRGLLLHIRVTNSIPIKAVLIHPNVETASLTTLIRPLKNTATEILIRVFIGAPGRRDRVSTHLRVLEFDRPLPRFCTQVFHPEEKEEPEGHIDIEANIRADPASRIFSLNRWVLKNFLVSEEDLQRHMESLSGSGWSVAFRCCYTKEVLIMRINDNGHMTIKHNDINMVGEIVQSLVLFMELKTLNFRANFPKYQAELNKLIGSMEDLYAMNDKLTTEWTERLNFIRETVVRAEDALATRQLARARKLYVRVALLNRECVTQRLILLNARDNLISSLKSLNQMIKQNAQLRVGEDANELVKECRRPGGHRELHGTVGGLKGGLLVHVGAEVHRPVPLVPAANLIDANSAACNSNG